MSYGHSFFLYLESDPPAGAAPAWSPLREECIARLCHGGIKNGAPARTCTSNLRLRRAACTILLHLGSEYPRQESHLRRELRKLAFFLLNYGDGKVVRHAGAAPAPAVWKTAVLAVTPMTRKRMVAAAGIAPASPPLQGGANLSQLNSQNGPSTR